MTDDNRTYIHTYTKKAFENLELLRSWLEKNYKNGQGLERIQKHEQRKIQDVFSDLKDVKYIGNPKPAYYHLDKEDYIHHIMNASLEDVFSSADISLGNVFDEDKPEPHSEYPKKKFNALPKTKPDANNDDFNKEIKKQIIRLNNCVAYLSNTNFPEIIMN